MVDGFNGIFKLLGIWALLIQLIQRTDRVAGDPIEYEYEYEYRDAEYE